ncbi:MAG TPA: hypothetical protein VHZ55_02665 [Bryobacteraceae bacterium]|nr:hypothetical protein [Bryobacteraceae bacterium]
MGEILIRGTVDDLFDTRVSGCRRCCGSERIVRLESHHWSYDNAGRQKGLFEQSELRQQRRLNAFTVL